MPCAETHLRAFCQVLKEYIAHSPVGGAVIDKKIGLKIIFEAAEIKNPLDWLIHVLGNLRDDMTPEQIKQMTPYYYKKSCE